MTRTAAICFVLALFLGSLAATGADVKPKAEPDSIGVASVYDDGTIRLKLKAQSGTAFKETAYLFPPEHPQYQIVADHVGRLTPGIWTPVPPWPENFPVGATPR